MKSRQLQYLLFGLITVVGCLVFINVEVLEGVLSMRRRRADDAYAVDAVSRAVADALRNQALSGSELLGLLSAQQAAQASTIANLTARIDAAIKLQRQLASGQPLDADARPRVVSAPAALSGAQAKATTPHAVVIFAFNRPAYLERALRSVTKHLPTDGSYTLVVSQDGNEPGVAEVIAREGGARALHLRHPRSELVLDAKQRRFAGYYCLAQHYGWALGELLGRLGFEDVVILEDDIEVAPDFFAYFEAMRPLLDADASLLTVSAFADNGQPQHVFDPAAVYRSDFFPGLGWLMTKRLWAELGPKWPRAFWDDWLREPANRRGRASIRPEISRTHTYGVKGVSSGQFSHFLRSMRLAEGGVDWAVMDVRWLTQARYDQIFDRQLAAAVELAPSALPAKGAADCADARISYGSHTEFERLAKQLGLMSELKAGVPRTAYRGVVTFRRGACRIFLAPSYDIDPETHSIVRAAR